MLRFALLSAGIAAALSAPARGAAPIYDAITLNIGLNCQWQQKCIREQKGAQKRSLKYVVKYHPPAWRVQLCNRNARRGSLRVDWVGFDHCIRNANLRPPPPPPAPPRKKKRPSRVNAA